MVTQIIEWHIDITPQDEELYTTESILNTRSEEYNSFIDGMVMMLDSARYILNEEHESNHKDSASMYYEFLKLDNDACVKVIVYVRVSDHKVGDRKINGKNTTAKQRMQSYLDNTRVTQIMNDFGNKERPTTVPVDIVFDDCHYFSYIDALVHINQFINTKLDKL